jgi:DNA-binding response OmpR family regulator
VSAQRLKSFFRKAPPDNSSDELSSLVKSESRVGAGEVILVVEDDDNVRQLLVDIFTESGYAVRQAVDGLAGLDVLRAEGRIDLVVTDVGLPGTNGRQMVDAAREKRPPLNVLFITGYAAVTSVATGFVGKGMQMIAKPFTVEAMSARVQEILGGRI